MSSSLYVDHVKKKTLRWQQRFSIQPRDGLVVLCAKKLLELPMGAWRRFFFLRIMIRLERPSHRLCIGTIGNDSPEIQFQFAIDLYKACMSMGLFVAYLIVAAVFALQPCRLGAFFILLPSVLFAVGRTAELFTLLLILYSDSKYHPKSFSRSVANSFWHYLELTLAFAVFYGAFASLFPGSLSGPGVGTTFGTRLLTPMYFSFITISTVGYGDIAPVGIVQILVFLQVLLGFALLVVVIPTCVAALGERSPDQPTTGLLDPLRIQGHRATWLRQLEFNNDGVLSASDGSYSVGAVLFVESICGQFVLVTKASKDGYELGGMQSLPGGVVRGRKGDNILERIRISLAERVKAETGLSIDPESIEPIEMLPPPVARYSSHGNIKSTIVLPFKLRLDSNSLPLESSTDSVSAVCWTGVKIDWSEISPANRLILAHILWTKVEDPQLTDFTDGIGEALKSCNQWASDVGLPPTRMWFL